MHLSNKGSKYAFAYASMQMHNYPKPINKYVKFRNYLTFRPAGYNLIKLVGAYLGLGT